MRKFNKLLLTLTYTLYRGLVIKGRRADQSAGKVKLTFILPTQKMNAATAAVSASHNDVTTAQHKAEFAA